MEFDLQRFDEDTQADAQAETAQDVPAEEQEPIPDELSGLPEDIARETMAEWEQSQTEQESESAPETESAPEEPPITREDYQAKVAEVEQLKAQLAAYQQQQQPQPQAQQQPQPQQQPPQPQQPPQFQPPQLKITPEVSKQINEAIRAEAMALSGFSQDDVASLDYADADDPRIEQWAQAKNIAQNRVLGAIQSFQIAQQQRAQQFYNEHAAAINAYNQFAQKAFAEPDFQAIQQFATNEYFEQLQPDEQKIIANSYIRVERQLASPAEMLVVKNYFEQAKAAYRTRGSKNHSIQRDKKVTPKLPRSDQLKGSSTTSDGQLSAADIEKLLERDFTTLTHKQQKIALGLT